MSATAVFGAVPKAPPAPTRSTELHGQVSVREVEISVALPDDISLFRLRSLGGADFIVLRDGKEQPVARAERSRGDDRPWRAVIWLDDLLAAPESLNSWAQALGERAKDLAKLGSVEIVVADPLLHTALAATSDARAIKAALETAGAAARSRAGAGSSKWKPPGAAELQAELVRLVDWVAARRAVGPRALWLAIDGRPMPMAAVGQLYSAIPAVGEDEAVTALRSLGLGLAGTGWTTLALTTPIRKSTGGTESPESSYDRWHREVLPNKPDRLAISLFRWPPLRSRSVFDSRTLDAELDPALAAPRLVAEQSGGYMLPGPWELRPTLDQLAERWRVWIRADEAPDGKLHTLSVMLKKGGELRSTRWLLSPAPESPEGQ
ncbi:MAG: hypothetical protein ABI609_03440 [Acidobacteriota bacterium]